MCQDLSPDTSRAELHELLHDYNWDDGVMFPQAITDHPNCDLSLALDAFWLTDAYEVLVDPTEITEFNAERLAFGRWLASRILAGHYPRTIETFRPPISRVQRYSFAKRGLPSIFLDDIPAPATTAP